MSDSAPPSLWRLKTFRYIWGGQTASIFGDRVTGLALPWLILSRTHSAFDAGLVSAARYLPFITLGLVAGVAADRMDRRALMVACDVARALALGAIVVLGLLGLSPPLWLLALVVLALGAGGLLFEVAYRAWLPDVTGDRLLGRATAALEASDAAGTLAGPPLGGALVGAIGPVLALGADASSNIVSALTLMRARADVPPHGATPARRDGSTQLADAWRDAGAGARFILASPAQRLLKGVGAALYLDTGAVELLLATLAQLRLHLPPWQAGLVFGAAGVGGLIGAAAAPRFEGIGWRRGLAAACAVAALGSLGLCWACVLDPTRGFIVALVANLVLDGGVALGFILVVTAGALVTPRTLRGRVNAAGAIYSSTVRAVAVAGAGLLAARGDPLPAFALLACCLLAAALVALRASIRRVPA